MCHCTAQSSLSAHNDLLERVLAREREQPMPLPIPQPAPPPQQPSALVTAPPGSEVRIDGLPRRDCGSMAASWTSADSRWQCDWVMIIADDAWSRPCFWVLRHGS